MPNTATVVPDDLDSFMSQRRAQGASQSQAKDSGDDLDAFMQSRQSATSPSSNPNTTAAPAAKIPLADVLNRETQEKPFPQPLQTGLERANQYLVQPFEKMSKWGAETGAEAAEGFMTPGYSVGKGGHAVPKEPPSPTTVGIARGVGSTLGGAAADPRNWPLMGAAELAPVWQRLMSTGFTAQMGKGTYEQAKQLVNNWDNLSPAQRAEGITSSGLGAIFTGLAAHGAVDSGTRTPAARPEGSIGPKQEPLAPESPKTISAQVDALKKGTNKVVYIPKGTENIPAPPESSHVTVVPGDQAGAGTYYHTADVTPEQVKSSVEDGTFGKLLGYQQSKEAALGGKAPAAITARDANGVEVKGALADISDPHIVAAQAAELARQFPDAKIGIEPPENVVHERLGTKSTQSAVSQETPQAGNPTTIASTVPEDLRPLIQDQAMDLFVQSRQVRPIDPNLADGLSDIADGKLHSPDDLQKFVNETIRDPKAKTELTKLVSDYAAKSGGEPASNVSPSGGKFSTEGNVTPTQLTGYAEKLRAPDPPLARIFDKFAGGDTGALDDLRKYVKENVFNVEQHKELLVAIDAAESESTAITARRSSGNTRSRESTATGNAAPQERFGEVRTAETNNAAERTKAAATEGATKNAELLKAESVKKPRAPKKPTSDEIVQEAYRPGNVVKSYGGTYDKVTQFIPGDESKPWPANSWQVKVIGSDKNGNPRPGERERTHSTMPERADLLAAQKRLMDKKVEKAPASELARGNTLFSNPVGAALSEGSKLLSRVWDQKVARPLIDKVLKIGDKYQKAREADPTVAEGLHLLDNAPQYLRAKAAQQIHNVVGGLSRAQERLFTLMADADSRENLRANHGQEYRLAQNDPAIQAALRKYKPLEQELTSLREKMGGQTLEQDYLRRVYEKYIAGVNKPEAEGRPAESTPSQFDRVIRPQSVNPKSREASAEYFHENGLHEFGPAFATKYVATHLKALRDEVAQEFLSKATMLPTAGAEPRSIEYGDQRYYRPDVAREMSEAGGKGAKEYGYYDPTQGEKFPTPAEGRYLGPKEITKTLTDYGSKEVGEPGSIRRFFQEQILGFGFGVPHIFNILRRVTQQTEGGAVNPAAWARAMKVAFGKELRSRGIEGLNDPTFDMLAKHGAISTGEVASLKKYIGGNLNPANWMRGIAQVGHRTLFDPSSFHGFGGLDQRARVYVADLVRSQRPGLSGTEVSRAVNDALGGYNRANWTDRQKLLGRFMMFPGWDFASLRWVLQHPIRTTLPPAILTFLANRALHSVGQNRDEDQNDISAIHIGDRAYNTGLLRESMARNLFRPALNFAQAKIRGENNQRAFDEAARGAGSGAGGLLSTMRPDLSGFVALATNRESLSSRKELLSKQDLGTPGKILPSKALEKLAVFTVRHALPALDRILDSHEDIDLRSFAGGNLGVPNYEDSAEQRLNRNAAEASRVKQAVSKLAKTNPAKAREYLKDPDNAVYSIFSNDLAEMAKNLHAVNQRKQTVEESNLPDAEKQNRLQALEKVRANVLAHADALNNVLFSKRMGKRAGIPMTAPVTGSSASAN